MSDEIFFLYKEHLEFSRLYLWYTGSKHSFHDNKASKAEAEHAKTMSNYYFKKLCEKIRGQ